MSIHVERRVMLVALIVGHVAFGAQEARFSAEAIPPAAPQEPLMQVLRASDWKGAVQFSDEGCTASTGEYTLWVYAAGTRCGVPRDQADRVVIIRQPLPGVSAITAAAQVPAGTYAVWVYGAGDPGYPWLRLCGRSCVRGEFYPRIRLGSHSVRSTSATTNFCFSNPGNNPSTTGCMFRPSCSHQPQHRLTGRPKHAWITTRQSSVNWRPNGRGSTPARTACPACAWRRAPRGLDRAGRSARFPAGGGRRRSPASSERQVAAPRPHRPNHPGPCGRRFMTDKARVEEAKGSGLRHQERRTRLHVGERRL